MKKIIHPARLGKLAAAIALALCISQPSIGAEQDSAQSFVDMVKEVPLAGFTLYNEFTEADIGYFQKFFDVFTERKIFSRTVPVKPLLYTA